MRVSLALKQDPAVRAATQPAEALLVAGGPRAIIGHRTDVGGLTSSIVPGAASLFGPRGAIVNPLTGALAVADTGHHRLMFWRQTPKEDYVPADFQVGQRNFACEGRNGKGGIGAATLNVPTGLATDGCRLAVADAWNHRILIWNHWPQQENQPADVVVGQRDAKSGEANRGGAPRADTLNWCYGVSFLGKRLAVADTGNRRVLLWDEVPEQSGQPADKVIGQSDFASRDDNAGRSAGLAGTRWPHAIARHNDLFMVADAGNNRVMVWRGNHIEPGAPCAFILGQRTAADIDHNGGRYLPSSRSLNMPYGLCVGGSRLVVADTANSRLLAWPLEALSMDAPAGALTGQSDFGAKGDNRWAAPVRDSLCWPYGVTSSNGMVAIADSGNNRVLLWEIAA